MSFRQIQPTKSNLMDLKDRLEFVKKGEEFLEYKREQLIQKIRNIWSDYKRQRKDFYSSLKSALVTLTQTYKEMGKRELFVISKIGEIQFSPKIDINYLKQIGIIIPRIDYELEREESLPPYSFEGTSQHLDELINQVKKLFEKIILLSETEDILLKYARNFQKIDRRINGLKNITKPQIKNRIKRISSILEENQRESFTMLKKTKEIISDENNKK